MLRFSIVYHVLIQTSILMKTVDFPVYLFIQLIYKKRQREKITVID